MNKIILKGRLTENPDVKKTPNEIPVATFTVAVNRRFDREKTDFIRCEAWRNTAEFVAKYFSKGKDIMVVGELHIDKSEKDGETRFFTKVVADEVEFCGNKSDNVEKSDATSNEKADANSKWEEIPQDDELPFF